MPRIHTKKKEYMIGDLPGWIIGRMYIKGLKQKDLAELLGITPQAFSARLHKDGKGDPKDVFTYGDLLTLFKALDATDEEILRLTKM